MAYVSTARIAATEQAAGIQGFLANFRAAIGRRRLYARTLTELRQLTDRELADLGISRLSIVDVAREAAYGK